MLSLDGKGTGQSEDTNADIIILEACQRLFGDNFFYYFLFLAKTYTIYVNVFYVVRNEITVESDKKWKNSPYIPIVKIAHSDNVMSIALTLSKCAIFTMGVFVEILCLLSDPT